MSVVSDIVFGMVRGRLLVESLRLVSDLSVPGLRMVRLHRRDMSGSVAGTQPATWSCIDFEADDEVADLLAGALADALRPEDGWYADFAVADDHVVVFAGQTFRYRRGDAAARAEAVAYGLSAGTPAHQLDWAE